MKISICGLLVISFFKAFPKKNLLIMKYEDFIRFLHLTVGAGVLAHWKTFSFTQSDNDQETSSEP